MQGRQVELRARKEPSRQNVHFSVELHYAQLAIKREQGEQLGPWRMKPVRQKVQRELVAQVWQPGRVWVQFWQSWSESRK